MGRFADKVVVTGGGGATCRAFGRDGARVGVFDLNLEAAEKVAADIRSSGGRALALTCDIANRAQADAAVAAVEAELGAIDALVNNAGWDVFQAGIAGMGMYALKLVYDTDESREGVAALKEKRKPEFRKFAK